jgi:HPt (histidine-containing phosphotransfer) domain-containing protein
LFPARKGAVFVDTDLLGDIYRFFHHQVDKGNMTQRKQTSDYVAETPLDLCHLERNTLGNAEVAREVLTLFERQASRVIREIECASSRTRLAALAHSLKGSARGVGASKVAAASEDLERAAEVRDSHALKQTIATLAAALEEARRAIDLHFSQIASD